MRKSNTLLALLSLCISIIAAAPTPGSPFYLQVNGVVWNAGESFVRDNNTYDLGVTLAPFYSNGAYGDHELPFQINSQNTREVLVLPTNPNPGPIVGRLALVSTGVVAGDWQLSKAYPQDGGGFNIGSGRDGATVKTVGWEFQDPSALNGGTALRFNAPDGVGKWLAVREQVTQDGRSFERFLIHWFNGNGDDIPKIGDYTPIEVQVVSQI